MPEGDSVWNMARKLHHGLAGTQLEAADFRVPQLATVTLKHWTVTESASRGKHLLLRLRSPQGEPFTLHSHLRMDGTWRLYLPGERWNARPPHTIRVILRAEALSAVGYHLHELALVRTADEGKLVGHLGPDLLGDDWDPDEAVRRLRRHPDVTIGEALLDQRNLAGIGNIWKAETLFLHRTWPWLTVGEVEDLRGLVTIAQRLLDQNRFGRGKGLQIYGRRGQPCSRCGRQVKVQGQGERVTYWCEVCQPAPVNRNLAQTVLP
jgi:endonuclease VIII